MVDVTFSCSVCWICDGARKRWSALVRRGGHSTSSYLSATRAVVDMGLGSHIAFTIY
jgi:hypothetical protein